MAATDCSFGTQCRQIPKVGRHPQPQTPDELPDPATCDHAPIFDKNGPNGGRNGGLLVLGIIIALIYVCN